jgi:hypothetical protein
MTFPWILGALVVAALLFALFAGTSRRNKP